MYLAVKILRKTQNNSKQRSTDRGSGTVACIIAFRRCHEINDYGSLSILDEIEQDCWKTFSFTKQ